MTKLTKKKTGKVTKANKALVKRRIYKFSRSDKVFACNGKKLVHKNRKFSKNDKVRKGEDRQSNKDYEGPRQAVNLANLAKVTSILPATAKRLFTAIVNIATITKLAKEKKGKVTKTKKALAKP